MFFYRARSHVKYFFRREEYKPYKADAQDTVQALTNLLTLDR